MRLPQPIDDGLIIPEVGSWSREKHHFLLRYVDAFTTAMKNSRWRELHYIDLFAGAGIERIEQTNILEWGSPLIAAQASPAFDKLHAAELNLRKFTALKKRMHHLRPNCADQVLRGDANVVVEEIVNDIPSDTLSLAFLDPYNLQVAYATLQRLSRIRADFIIFFPDHLDIQRNWQTYYWLNPQSNLDVVLGPGSNWRDRIRDVPAHKYVSVFRDLYISQIRKLGYRHFAREPIPNQGSPLYSLIFCSRSPVALKIWRGTSRIKPGGQRTLFE
jgi:three-Cys-motif partner protein